MAPLLDCPNCGPREMTDFGFGGELRPRPPGPLSFRELNQHLYFRKNAAGPQLEWWVHRSGCGEWFVAERDTRSDEVLWTAHRAPADAGTLP